MADTPEGKSEVDDFLRTLDTATRFEGGLKKYLAGSWVATCIAQLVQLGKFPPAFLALTNVLVFAAGAAAVMLVYFERHRHPAHELNELLWYRPAAPGFRAVFGLVVFGALFYGYWVYAERGDRRCLPFLIVAVFFLYWALFGVVLELMTLGRQKKLWAALPPDRREDLKQGERDVLKAVSEGEEVLKTLDARMREIDEADRNLRRDVARNRWRTWWKLQEIRTRPWRKKLGLVTKLEIAEDLLAAGEARKRKREIIGKLAAEALKQSTAHPIEGTSWRVYEREAWKFVPVEEPLTLESAKALTASLAPLAKDGKLNGIALVLRPAAVLSVEAKAHLEQAGVYLVELGG